MPQRTPPKPCRLCGSERVVTAQLEANSSDITVNFGLTLRPKALLDKRPLKLPLTNCEVCLDCADVRLTLTDPDKIRGLYDQALEANGLS